MSTPGNNLSLVEESPNGASPPENTITRDASRPRTNSDFSVHTTSAASPVPIRPARAASMPSGDMAKALKPQSSYEKQLQREREEHMRTKHELLKALSPAPPDTPESARLLEQGTSRLIEATIDAHDLEPEWDDKQAGFTDWRLCPVGGQHLGSSEFASEGANGSVLRARWKSSIAVAVKEGNWDRTTDEMRLFLDLNHPHIVACYGILEELRDRETKDETGRITGIEKYRASSIVTERCEVPLLSFLKDHKAWDQDLFGNTLTPGMVDMRKYTILLHVSLGLQKLHDMNVLHRDIKSGNILLDGAPGTCESCQHAGNWKICDFGEAKVLRTPSLMFAEPSQWPRGWSAGLAEQGRFQKATSPFLLGKGARYYCWLLPGETIEPAEDYDEPTPLQRRESTQDSVIHRVETNPLQSAPGSPASPWAQGKPWEPCAHGGFVYLFSDDVNQSDPRDIFFDVSATTNNATSPEPFPQSLGPFGLAPTEIRPELDFDKETYEISETFGSSQMELLRGFGKLPLTGQISPLTPVTLTPGARRQAMIPDAATWFVYMYQGIDLEGEELTAEQKKELDVESGDMCFVSLGGFIYLDVDRKPVAANAILRISSQACRVGTINRAVCKACADSGVCPHPDVCTECDNSVTAGVASPELHDGYGIGLETDIFSLGVVMWEVFTRREAWHWVKDGPGKAQAIMSQVLTKHLRPKIPEGLSEECAKMVRKCLNADPSKRPSCKEVSDWIDRQRRGLQTELAKARSTLVTEREERRREKDASWTGKQLFRDSCQITNWGDSEISKYWSDKGRFSLYKTWSSGDVTENTKEFSIEVTPVKPEVWIEIASGSVNPDTFKPVPEPQPQPEPEPEPEDGTIPVEVEPESAQQDLSVVIASFSKAGKLGIVFGDQWPFIRRVEVVFETQSQAERTNDNPRGSLNKNNLVPGCRLMAINQTKVDREDGTTMTFTEAKQLLKAAERSFFMPLELTFEPTHRFGLSFIKRDGHGGWLHTWPVVAQIVKVDTVTHQPTLFSQHPKVRAGSTLKAINGVSCGTLAVQMLGGGSPRQISGELKSLEAALPLLWQPTVRLDFVLGAQKHTSVVDPWLVEGLNAVSTVRRHEAQFMVSATREASGGFRPPYKTKCDSHSHSHPEPEPEPEPEEDDPAAEASTAARRAEQAETQLRASLADVEAKLTHGLSIGSTPLPGAVSVTQQLQEKDRKIEESDRRIEELLALCRGAGVETQEEGTPPVNL